MSWRLRADRPFPPADRGDGGRPVREHRQPGLQQGRRRVRRELAGEERPHHEVLGPRPLRHARGRAHPHRSRRRRPLGRRHRQADRRGGRPGHVQGGRRLRLHGRGLRGSGRARPRRRHRAHLLRLRAVPERGRPDPADLRHPGGRAVARRPRRPGRRLRAGRPRARLEGVLRVPLVRPRHAEPAVVAGARDPARKRRVHHRGARQPRPSQGPAGTVRGASPATFPSSPAAPCEPLPGSSAEHQ